MGLTSLATCPRSPMAEPTSAEDPPGRYGRLARLVAKATDPRGLFLPDSPGASEPWKGSGAWKRFRLDLPDPLAGDAEEDFGQVPRVLAFVELAAVTCLLSTRSASGANQLWCT